MARVAPQNVDGIDCTFYDCQLIEPGAFGQVKRARRAVRQVETCFDSGWLEGVNKVMPTDMDSDVEGLVVPAGVEILAEAGDAVEVGMRTEDVLRVVQHNRALRLA